jgi:hypothetical protein
MRLAFCAACGLTAKLAQHELYFDWRDVGLGRDGFPTTAFAEERLITLCEECSANARDWLAGGTRACWAVFRGGNWVLGPRTPDAKTAP